MVRVLNRVGCRWVVWLQVADMISIGMHLFGNLGWKLVQQIGIFSLGFFVFSNFFFNLTRGEG